MPPYGIQLALQAAIGADSDKRNRRDLKRHSVVNKTWNQIKDRYMILSII